MKYHMKNFMIWVLLDINRGNKLDTNSPTQLKLKIEQFKAMRPPFDRRKLLKEVGYVLDELSRRHGGTRYYKIRNVDLYSYYIDLQKFEKMLKSFSGDIITDEEYVFWKLKYL